MDCRSSQRGSSVTVAYSASCDGRDRLSVGRDRYRAYGTGDRGLVEQHLTEDFRFSSPADVDIDRSTYFERCWPNSESIEAFEFKRLVEAGDEVIVTYESRKTK
jgi:hypothetical protein